MNEEKSKPGVVFNAAVFNGWVEGTPQNLPETFCGVTQDTRYLKPGMLYVALQGENFDGHDFVKKAFESGAAVALVEKRWADCQDDVELPLIIVNDTRRALLDAASAWRAISKAKIIGITGSSGKTTTKEITAAFFSAGGGVCSTKGNLNNQIGLPLSVLSMQPDCEFGVFELGTNHPGEIPMLAQVLRPDVGVITSVGSAHIENFCSLKSIAREKGAMLKYLNSGGFAVLSMEMQQFLTVRSCCAAPVITVSLVNKDADYFGEIQDLLQGDVIITEKESGIRYSLQSDMPGKYNVYNLMLAFAAACHSGIPAEAAIKLLSRIEIPGMRWQMVPKANDINFINDAYNANPESVKAVLEVFGALQSSGRKVLVLGDMLELGDFSASLHQEVGEAVASVEPSFVCLVGPFSSRYTLQGAISAGYSPKKIHCFNDAGSAGRRLADLLEPDDLILLKASRGMHMEEVLNAF